MDRLAVATPVLVCDSEHHLAVLEEAQKCLSSGEWEPPLPDGFSLMMVESSETPEVNELLAYELPEFACDVLVDHFEKHPKYREWGVWDARAWDD